LSQTTPTHDSLIDKQQELNLKSCQLFAEQFQDSNNAEIASACDYIQQDGPQSLAQQKAQSVVALQDHSQHIFKALRELQQNYVRCQSIPACSQRMDQTQVDNFNKIQSLTEDFLLDGFVNDNSDPQSFLSMPTIAPIQFETPSKILNRPNSTLERAAPYIRSLRDDSTDSKKKEGDTPRLQSQETAQTQSQSPETAQEQQQQMQGNLSSLIKDQVSKMFSDFVSRSEKLENEQEAQFERSE